MRNKTAFKRDTHKYFTVYLDKNLIKQIKDHAKKTHVSQSKLTKEALESFLSKEVELNCT